MSHMVTLFLCCLDSVITWEEGEIRKGLSFVRKEGCRVLWSCLELLIPNKTISISADDDDEEEGEEEENKMYSVEVKSEGMDRYTWYIGIVLVLFLCTELPVEDNIGNVVDYGYETTRRPTTEFPTQGPHRFWRDQSGTPLQPPDSCFAVTGILQHLRLLNDPKDPTVIQRLAPRVLREMVNDYWLNALWELLNEGIELQDEECCSAIADLLCHMGKILNNKNIWVGYDCVIKLQRWAATYTLLSEGFTESLMCTLLPIILVSSF